MMWNYFYYYFYIFGNFKCSQLNTIGCVDQNIEEEEIRARSYLDELNDELNERRSKAVTAEWNFNVNITKENEEIKDAIAAENAEYFKVSDIIGYSGSITLLASIPKIMFFSRFLSLSLDQFRKKPRRFYNLITNPIKMKM